MPTDSLRLFFALPCPPDVARALCAWRDGLDLGGRPVPEANLHLTLAFLGAQPRERLDALLQLGQSLRGSPVTLRLERLHLGRRGLLWIEPDKTPPAVLGLSRELRLELGRLGVPFDDKPFRPHVTLMREARRTAAAEPPAIDCRLDSFGLYRSDTTQQGVRYRALGLWPLND